MRTAWPTCLFLSLCVALLTATPAAAQWHDDDHPIALTPPEGWSAMSDTLLVEVNRTVRHVTPGPFRAGFQAFDNDVLLFPYLLVQYAPYTDLPEDQRPTYRLDEYDTLQLIARLVRNFRAADPLPEAMTADGFAQAYDTSQVKLLAVDAGGVFEIAGTLPLRDGGTYEYHTVGRIGREGVAFVTVFTNEGMQTVRPVADALRRSLAFDEGAGFDALPEREPEVVGFLPPPAEPMPGDALLGWDGRLGVVPAEGFTPLPAGSFEPHDPVLVSAYPHVLERAGALQVLTTTPTSRRITRPWAALSAIQWEWAGLGLDALDRRLTAEQWGVFFETMVGVDADGARVQVQRQMDDPDAPIALTGGGRGEESTPWLVDNVDLARGRVTFSRQVADAVDDTLQTRVTVTLVMGVEGVAALVTKAYTDAPAEEVAALAAMHESLRFAGGGRYVDVPPADAEAGAAGDAAGEPSGDADAPAGAEGASTTSATPPAAPPETTPTPDVPYSPAEQEVGSGALWLVLAGFAVVFLGVVAVVIVTSHAKAQRRREKARARRERQQSR